MSDLAPAKGELNGAFVISNVANCDIDEVDTSDALVKNFSHIQIEVFFSNTRPISAVTMLT